MMLWLAALVGAPGTTAADEGEVEGRVRAVTAALMAPCCFSQTAANHSSRQAAEMKQDVRSLLRQGWTEGDIVDAYVAKYGERILAAPRPSGFNLLAYVAPVLFLVGGAVVGASWLARHRSDPDHAFRGQSPLPEATRAQLEDLREQLSHLH